MGNRAAVVLALLLLAVPAHAVVNRIWGNNEADVSRLKAKADDELDAQDAAESTPWPVVSGAAPTCDDEGEAYYSSADDTLKVCDGSAWGTFEPGLALLLAGRPGGQSAYGGTASGNNLTLTPNSAATDGTLNLDGFIDFFDSAPDISGGSFPSADFFDFAIFDTDLDFATTYITRLSFLRLAPTIHLGQATAVIPVFVGVRGTGTITIDDATATPSAPNYQFFSSEWTNTSSIAGVPPVPGEVFSDSTTYEYTAATTTATIASNSPKSFKAVPTIKSTNTGTLQFTASSDFASFYSKPVVNASNASGNLNVTQFNHLYVGGLTQTAGGGTETVTTEIGVNVDTLNADTTSIGIKNDYSTVLTPTATILASTTTIAAGTATSSYSLCVGTCADTAGTLTWSGTGSTLISDGTAGQIIVLVNDDAADSITMTDGNNVSLCGAANYTFDAGEAVMLIWTSQNSVWTMICGDA